MELDAPDLLEPKDAAVPFDRCVTVTDRDGDVIDDVVVYLGLSGDVNDALRAVFAAVEDAETGDLRKTRAGGN